MLVNPSIISRNYSFLFVVKTFKIYCLSNFQVYNTALLIIITMLYIMSSELIGLINRSSCWGLGLKTRGILCHHDAKMLIGLTHPSSEVISSVAKRI